MKDMKNKIIVVYLLALLLPWGFVACSDDDFSDEPFNVNKEDIQIYDYIKGREELSIYKEIADYSGFYGTISTRGSYTVFVPDNNAFEQLFADLKISNYQEKTPQYWAYYMQYHSLEVKINTNAMQGGTMSQPTLMGREYYLTVNISDYSAIKLNGKAIIIDSLSNRETRNGYVNVIDQVLDPPIQTVYDVLVEHGGYSKMLRLFEEHGFLSYLTDSTVTVLVEPDVVFNHEDPAYALNTDTISDIKAWLRYHIFPERAFITDLNERCVQSLYKEDVTTFNYDNMEIGFYCNQKDYFSNRREYPVNVNALNGVVHSMGVPLRIRQHTAGVVRYNLYGRTNTLKGYELNVFAELPAYIREHVGYSSFHQGSINPEPPMCYLVTTQIGDMFRISVPEVVPGIYQVKMIFHPSICCNLMMSHESRVVNSNINLHAPEGDFPEYTTLKVKNCGQIEMLETGEVNLVFKTLENSGLLMDMLELEPYISFAPLF